MEISNAKGTRDVSGEDAILRQKIVATLKSVFELYGFNPLETPILERFETLSAKYAGGEEILKEVFKLQDQGKRDLALRYDLTVPFARFIAQNPNLKMPLKRYAIGSVFRDGPLKVGRYREFTQCDVDTVGNASMNADAELISIALDVFKELGMDVRIQVNNRKLLDALLEKLGIARDKIETTILSLDKLQKFGRESVEKELVGKGIELVTARNLLKKLGFQGEGEYNLGELDNLRAEFGNINGLDEIEKVLKTVNNPNVRFNSTLARGLSYYTGTVFEVFLSNSEISSSIAAGGRYDRMIGDFVGSNRAYPAVGISFGLDVISDALKLQKKNSPKTVVKAFIISIGEDDKANEFAWSLRKMSVSCDCDFTGKVSKAIEYANYYGIPFVVFIGKNEVAAKKVKLRNMTDGKEQLVSMESAIKEIKEVS